MCHTPPPPPPYGQCPNMSRFSPRIPSQSPPQQLEEDLLTGPNILVIYIFRIVFNHLVQPHSLQLAFLYSYSDDNQ